MNLSYASRLIPKHPFGAFCVLLFATLLSACAPKIAGPRPPEILYDHDLCAECGMIISEAKFAAATLLIDGDNRKFDDINEMLIYHMEHPEAQVKVWFVHDYKSEAWIRGETAFYVKSDSIVAPMEGGIVAFEDQAAAKAYATEADGQVFTLDDLRLEIHSEVHGS